MSEGPGPRQHCHPPPTQAPFVVQLIMLGRRLSYAIDRRLGRYGYNLTQASMLVALTKHPGLTAQDLSRPTWVEPSSVTRALQVLERRGLVARRAHPTDGRAMVLELTERGVEESRFIFELITAINSSFESSCDPDQIEAIRRVLPAWFERTDALWTGADLDPEEGATPVS